MSDDDDDDACRICRGRAEPGSAPLLSPCACDGSIALVHEDCLEEWLRHTHASSCELCGVEFHFEPLLAPDAPRELPRWKLALALGQRLSRFGPVLGRWLAVFLLWGIFLPLAICAFWLWLCHGLTFTDVAFARFAGGGALVSDWLTGVLMIVGTVFTIISVMSFADFLRFHRLLPVPRDMGSPRPQFVDEFGDIVMARRHAPPPERNDLPPAPLDRPDRDAWAHRTDAEWLFRALSGRLLRYWSALADVATPMDPTCWGDRRPARRLAAHGPRRGHGAEPVAAGDAAADDGWTDTDDEAAGAAPHERDDRDLRRAGAAARREERKEVEEEAGEGEEEEEALAFEGVEHVLPAPWHAAMRARQGVHRDQPPWARPAPPPPPRGGGRGGADAAAGHEGADGPQEGAADPAAWDMNGMPLGAEEEGPEEPDWGAEAGLDFGFVLGVRGPPIYILAHVFWMLVLTANFVMVTLFLPRSMGRVLLQHYLTPAVAGDVGRWMPARLAAESLGPGDDAFVLMDMLPVVLAYSFLAVVLEGLRTAFLVLVRPDHRPQLLLNAFYAVHALFKLTLLLGAKMIVFPLVLGAVTEVCASPLLDSTLAQRTEFLRSFPTGACMQWWVIGITFMLATTVVLLELRELLHPDVLAAWMRPPEPDTYLLRALLTDPVHWHFAKLSLSAITYIVILLGIVYLPGLALSRLLPSVFPIHLRLRWALPLLQVPLDAIILHSLHLRSLESVKHGARELLQRWLFLATRTLGLSRLLLPLYIPYELDARRRICFPRHVRSWLEAVEQAHAHMPAVPHRLRRLPAHASAACRRQQIRGTAPPPEADIRGDRLGRTLWQRLTRARRAAAHAQPQPQARQARSPQSIRRGPGRDGAAGAFRGTSADLVEVLDATGTALVRYVHDRATQLGMRGSRWASHEERPGAAEGAWGAGKAADPTSAGLPREGCTPPARVAVAHMPVLDDVAPNAYGPGGAGAIEQVVVVGPSSAILHRGLAGLPLGDWAFGRVPHNQAPALRPLPPGAADLEGVAEEVARHPEEGVDADEQGPAAVDEADVPDPVGAAGLRRRRGNGAEGEGEDAGGADAPAGPAGAGEEDHPPSPRPGHTFLLPEQLPPAVELAQLVQTPAAPLQLRLLAVRRGPPTRALLRWVALALSTWVAVVVVAALLSAIPLLLGRSLLHCLCIPEQMAHDPLALVLGFFLMGRVFALCDTAALAATRAMGSMRRAARRRARLGRALRRRLRRAMRGNGRQTTVSAAAAAEEAVQEEEAAVAAARHARRRGPAQATGLRCGEGMEGAVEVASPTMRDGRTFLRRWVAHLLVPVDADPLFEAQRGRYGGNVRRVVEAYAARTERAHGRPLLRSLSAAASSRAAALVHAFLVAAVVTPLALALLWRACVAGPIVGAVVPLDSWSTELLRGWVLQLLLWRSLLALAASDDAPRLDELPLLPLLDPLHVLACTPLDPIGDVARACKDVTPLAMVMALAGLANGYLGFLAPVAPGLAGPGPAVMLATVLFSLVALAVGVLLVFGSSIHVAMQQLHDNLLREQYVIGRRLLDRREWQERSGTPARPEAASAS